MSTMVVRVLALAMAAVPAGALVRPALGMHRAGAPRRPLVARGAMTMSEAPPMPDYPMVKSVSQTMRAFESLYPRPIVTIWRGSINDMLQVTHLSSVDQRFKYDAMFGYGYMVIFNMLLEKYPVAGEKDKLIDATIGALDLDAATIRRDYAEVSEWLQGKTEADILGAAASGASDPVSTTLAGWKATENLLHTRCGNFAVLTMLEAVGCKADSATLDRWAEALGMRKKAVESDAVLLKELREKLQGAMQIIKQMEIREKKRMADALEAKAKAAQEAAVGATAAAADIKAEA